MEVKNWFTEHGDETLALDWDLNENSHVWEIGGFEGRWAQQIWDKFHCNITIFEPQLWAVDRMQKRFEGIEKIDIRPYGLWIKDGKHIIGNYETDGATIIPSGFRVHLKGEGEFKRYTYAFDSCNKKIDLCLMNIEGAEYILIPKFISSGMMTYIENFWCQFHPVDTSDTRYLTIFDKMNKTYDMLWNCYPTAVAWRRRE